MRVLDLANAFWTTRERMMMVKCPQHNHAPSWGNLGADWLAVLCFPFRATFATWTRILRVRVKRRKKESHSTNVLPEVCTWEHFCATLRVLILQSSSSHRAIVKDFQEGKKLFWLWSGKSFAICVKSATTDNSVGKWKKFRSKLCLCDQNFGDQTERK